MRTHQTRTLTMLLATVCGLSLHANGAEAKSRKAKPLVVRGFISELSASSLTLNQTTILITDRTRFEDFDGNTTLQGAFQVGDCVKVKLVRSTTSPSAREVELEDRCPSTSTTTPSEDGKNLSENESPNDDSGHHAGTRVTPVATVSPAPTRESHHGNDDENESTNDDSGHHNRGSGKRG